MTTYKYLTETTLAKKIRPLAEGDTAYLAMLNAQTVALRTELEALK